VASRHFLASAGCGSTASAGRRSAAFAGWQRLYTPQRSCFQTACHRGASGARAFSLASCAAGDFFGLLASVPRLRDHTPAPQGRRRQAPQDRRRLTFFCGGAEIRRSRLWSLKSVLDALRVHAARPGTRHFRAEHVAGKARSGVSRGVRLGSKALQDPSRPPRASRPPDLMTF
jgi:hypothetical protein